MTDSQTVWQRFGIKSLSPAQINTANDDMGLWLARYVRRVRDDAGPAAWRGDAAEFGLYSYMREQPDPEADAIRTYEARSDEWAKAHEGEIHADYEKEKACIVPALQRAIVAYDALGYGPCKAYNLPLKGYLPGLDSVEFYCKPDFAYDWGCLDLKTSGHIPSKPKDGEPKAKTEHAIQFSIYAGMRGDSVARGLYVSTAGKPSNPWVLCELDKGQIDYYLDHVRKTVRRMECVMTAAVALSEYQCCTPEEALADLCSPNLLAQGGGLYPIWKEDMVRAATEAVPEWGL